MDGVSFALSSTDLGAWVRTAPCHLLQVKREELAPGPRPGKEMAVASGRHEGLRCVVVEVMPKEDGRSERCRVKIKPSDEEVQVG